MRWPGMRAALVALACAALSAPATAGAQRTSLVRIPIPQDDGTLTPYTFERAYPLVTMIYDTLMWRDAEGVPRPWLARSVTRSGDGRSVVIRLRRGVRWHDGRPLTARDVVFTLRYVATHPHPRFTPQVRDIAGASAPASDVVVLRLRAPSLGLTDQPLADVPILPRHLWGRLGPGRNAPPGLPVGSGPYRLVEHRRGERGRYVLEANRSYFRGRPLVDRVEVPLIDRVDLAVNALRLGRADVLQLRSDARPDPSPAIRVVSGPSYLGTALVLNHAAPPFDRPEVRQAVAQALDLGRIARTVGRGPTIVDLVPADRGYVSPDSAWASRRVLHRFEPGRARVGFAELGVPRIPILAPANDPVRWEAGRQVVLAIERAGGRAMLIRQSPAAIAEAMGGESSRVSFQAAITSTAPLASFDPAFLGALFRSGAPLNFGGYRSRGFDVAIQRVAEARTLEARRRRVDEVLGRLAQDLPVVPLFYAPARFGYRPAAFDGWIFVRGSGIVDKRSLLPRTRSVRSPRPAVADPLDVAPSGGRSLLPYLGIVGLLAAGAIVLLLRRRFAR